MTKPRSEEAWRVLLRLDSYFALASVKAGLILPANAVLLGVAAAGLLQLAVSDNPLSLGSATKILLSLLFGTTLASTALALLVAFGFLRSGNRPHDYKSLLFFGSIRSMDRDRYCSRFDKCSEDEMVSDVLRQVHTLSGGLNTKYLLLNWAVGLCAAGYVAAVAVATLLLWEL